MNKETANFYLSKEEPIKSCLLALRQIILQYDDDMTEAWKYGMPVFCYRGKMFCYLWIHKKTHQPYLGIVEGRKIKHPKLIAENRSRMKIMFVDPAKDLPMRDIRKIFKMAIACYN